MRLDGLSLRELAKEMDIRFRGSKVDKVTGVGKHAVFIALQRSGGILVSSSPLAARAQVMAGAKSEHGAEPSSFVMLLRKHLEGGRFLGATRRQLENAIEMSFSSWDDERMESPRMLLLEASGPDSNIFLLSQEGTIIGSFRHAREGRADAPGQRFEPLPRFELPDALECSRQAFIASAVRRAAELPGIAPASAISGGLFGLSRDHAEDLLKAAGFAGSSVFDAAASAHDALRQRQQEFKDEPWPCLEVQTLKGPRPSFILAGRDAGKLPSACLEGILGASESAEQATRISSELLKAVSSALSKAGNKLEARRQDLSEAKRSHKYRTWGDAILSSLHLLQGGLPERASLTDYSSPGEPQVEVPLERDLTAAQNAERYYSRYNRGRRAEKALLPLISAAEAEVDYLTGVKGSLERADGVETLQELKRELVISGYVADRQKAKGKAKAAKPALPAQYTLSTGHKALVGRNNMQNDQLTFGIANPWDIWLHVKGAPGSHVVIRLERGEAAPDGAIAEAAGLAAVNSSLRSSSKAEVDYTEARKVRKIPGGLPGAVTYTGQRSVTVDPSAPKGHPSQGGR